MVVARETDLEDPLDIFIHMERYDVHGNLTFNETTDYTSFKILFHSTSLTDYFLKMNDSNVK